MNKRIAKKVLTDSGRYSVNQFRRAFKMFAGMSVEHAELIENRTHNVKPLSVIKFQVGWTASECDGRVRCEI